MNNSSEARRQLAGRAINMSSGLYSADHYRRVFESTFEWICKNQEKFSVRSFSASPRLVDLIKPLGELVLSASLLNKLSKNALHDDTHSILEYAWLQLDRAQLLQDILTSRPDLLVLCTIYTTFKQSGFESPRFEDQLRKIVATPAYINLDLPAWRRLDLIHGLQPLGLASFNDFQGVFERTWLAGCYPPWTLTDATAYGVTHTIFYMTDYGSQQGYLPIKVHKYLKTALPAWTDYYIDQKDFDLAAEMVMCQYCIGLSTPSGNLAEEICQAQMSDGAVPAPPYGAINLLYGETDDERTSFLTNYHTTIVSCLAAGMYSDWE